MSQAPDLSPRIAVAFPNHELLKKWEDIRRQQDTNEKAFTESVFTNMITQLDIGKTSLVELNKYIKELSAVQKNYAKEVAKLGPVLDECNLRQHGTVKTMIEVLSKQNSNASQISEEQSKVLSDNVAQSLATSLSDYNKSSGEIIEGGKKLGKDLDSIREGIIKAFNVYCQSIAEATISDKVPSKDPWLAEQAYKQCLKLYKSEKEKYSQDMAKTFEKFLKLEEKRVEGLKEIMQIYIAKQKLMLSKMLENFGIIYNVVSDMNPVADRQLMMKERFSQNKSSIPPVAQQQIQPDHQDPVLIELLANFAIDDPPTSVRPLLTGYLYRQSSLMKSWKKNYFVLTNSFLHYFPSEEVLGNVSETTIPLGNINVQHLPDHEEKYVFELVVNPGAFFGQSKYLFRAADEAEMVDWIIAIKKYGQRNSANK